MIIMHYICKSIPLSTTQSLHGLGTAIHNSYNILATEPAVAGRKIINYLFYNIETSLNTWYINIASKQCIWKVS